MELTRNEQLETELLAEIDLSMQDDSRHQPSVSGMIYCLTKTYNEEFMVTGPVKHTDEQTLLFITGLGLEATLLKGSQISEAGETDGIQWHLDHFGTDGKFKEIKSTRGSSKTSENISEGWRKQILAYFYAKNITEGDLAILHLMGDYRPPMPQLRCWHMVATQDEVNENWTWIKQRAATYAEFVEAKEAPTPYAYNMDWECQYCQWKGLCDARKTLGSLMTL